MLICNNCNTLNPDGTVMCYHCNMRNRFTYRDAEADNTPPSVGDDNPTETCWNCGKMSGNGEKCSNCNIKLKLNLSLWQDDKLRHLIYPSSTYCRAH